MLNFFRGSATAMITPFTAEGKVNFEAFGRMIDYQIENGTDALVVLGTTATRNHDRRGKRRRDALFQRARGGPRTVDFRQRQQLHRPRGGSERQGAETGRRRSFSRYALLQQVYAERVIRIL